VVRPVDADVVDLVVAVAQLDDPVPGRNVTDLVAVPGSGQVEFDLTAVPAGEDDVRLIAWAPDVSANPVRSRCHLIGGSEPEEAGEPFRNIGRRGYVKTANPRKQGG